MAGDTFASRLLVTRSKVITREDEIASVEALIPPIPDDNRSCRQFEMFNFLINLPACPRIRFGLARRSGCLATETGAADYSQDVDSAMPSVGAAGPRMPATVDKPASRGGEWGRAPRVPTRGGRHGR